MKLTLFFANVHESDNCSIIKIDSSITNFIQINYIDVHADVISGQFECTFKEPECNEIITISHGRFDLMYRF